MTQTRKSAPTPPSDPAAIEAPDGPKDRAHQETMLDDALEASFPASDPPAITLSSPPQRGPS